jgi:hypothetical protein
MNFPATVDTSRSIAARTSSGWPANPAPKTCHQAMLSAIGGVSGALRAAAMARAASSGT